MIAALERLRDEHEPSVLPKQMAASGISGSGAGGCLLYTSRCV